MKLTMVLFLIVAFCIGSFIFLYSKFQDLNSDLQMTNIRIQSIDKINELTKQLHLNQMTNLYLTDRNSINNYKNILVQMNEYLATCKANSAKKNEKKICNSNIKWPIDSTFWPLRKICNC